jgi:hypothetical protein
MYHLVTYLITYMCVYAGKLVLRASDLIIAASNEHVAMMGLILLILKIESIRQSLSILSESCPIYWMVLVDIDDGSLKAVLMARY